MSPNLLIAFKRGSVRLLHFFQRSLLIFSGAFLLSCGNQLELFSDTGTDNALYFTALEKVRSGDYASAIDACSSMSENYLLNDDAGEVCASAYAGRCGFTLLNTIQEIDTYVTDAPAEKIFGWYLTQITSSSVQNISDCDTAESILRNLGSAANRTEDQNAMMTLLAIRKIAVIADQFADINDDEALDGGFDACSLSVTVSNQIGSAFWELDKSVEELSSNSYYTDIDTAVDTICTALNGLGGDLCGATDPEVLDLSQRQAAQSILAEGAVLGVDQCTGSSPLGVCDCLP